LRGLERLPTPDEVWDRAVEVHAALAERGQHRAVAIPDLIIAAVAERHDLPVLHYDRDFEVIAEVTGQPVEWVVPPGTAD
ncbi:MAG: PIN domain-containing protein, partial [Pseudonocardiaceae bacterium]